LAGVQVDLVDAKYAPHCLTRDFSSFMHRTPADLSQHIRPEAIDDILREDDYYKFLVKFEDGPHITIPKFIMGDFRLFTSPNGQCPLSCSSHRSNSTVDPVFFILHAQIDRIWWRWQQYDLPRQENQYKGKYAPMSEQQANIDDMMFIGGLAPDVKVSELMNIPSG
jgi:tyrosinase